MDFDARDCNPPFFAGTENEIIHGVWSNERKFNTRARVERCARSDNLKNRIVEQKKTQKKEKKESIANSGNNGGIQTIQEQRYYSITIDPPITSFLFPYGVLNERTSAKPMEDFLTFHLIENIGTDEKSLFLSLFSSFFFQNICTAYDRCIEWLNNENVVIRMYICNCFIILLFIRYLVVVQIKIIKKFSHSETINT